MTNEDNVLNDLSSVLDRLNGRLDAMEKGEREMPEGLREHMKDRKEEKDEGPEEDDEEEKMYGAHAKAEHADMAEKSDGYSDVITSEYLNWMENTLKAQGVDTSAARAHFDDISKANLGSTPEQIGDGGEYFGGQAKGRVQEGGSPSTNAISRMNSSGSAEVAKGYINADTVSPADLEAAYEVYKQAALEEQFKNNLGSVFADRLAKELNEEAEAKAAASFDARTPLANIEKALSDLSARIDNISSSGVSAPEIRKSMTTVEVPSTEDLANMDWAEVHRLAGSVFEN